MSSWASGANLDRVKAASAAKAKALPPSSKAPPQPVVTKINKKRPEHGAIQMDLLEMALQAQRAKEERKRRLLAGPAASAQQPPLPLAPSAASAATSASSAGNAPIKRIGKVRGAGEIARRKNRLTTLKKAILREKRAGFHVANSKEGNDHPALLGLDCVWLPELDLSDEAHHQADESSAAEEEVEEKAMANQVEFDATIASPVFFGCCFKLATPSALLAAPAAAPRQQRVGDYVTQALSPRLDELVHQMLERLFKFQERARLEDAVKAKLRRRLVLGLREVRKGVKTKRCIAVILAPNIEDVHELDEKVEEILHLCRNNPNRQEFESEIPVIFTGLSKQRLGRCMGIARPVSVVGVFSADGAHEEFKQAVNLAQQLAHFWSKQVQEEATLALERGARPWCLHCLRPVLEEVRRTCMRCESTFCKSCSDSLLAKKIACRKSNSGGETDQAQVCHIVRIARALPELGSKPKFCADAKPFVPLQMPPDSGKATTTVLSKFAKEFVPTSL